MLSWRLVGEMAIAMLILNGLVLLIWCGPTIVQEKLQDRRNRKARAAFERQLAALEDKSRVIGYHGHSIK